jgi:hypothetical protein
MRGSENVSSLTFYVDGGAYVSADKKSAWIFLDISSLLLHIVCFLTFSGTCPAPEAISGAHPLTVLSRRGALGLSRVWKTEKTSPKLAIFI